MSRVASPQELVAARNGLDVVLHIRGHGALTMPRNAAHELARDLMKVVGEIDALSPAARWPNLKTKM